ncbi:MAG TPA: DCC1-like thiol-disulfide oxidoreductase family protein [Terriglobales bacterium]|nr:DCC1-like thiol-disulfide oxidoreductase family protein [Terriglobales bacterium]
MARAPAGRVSALPNQRPGLIERYGLTRRDVDRYVWTLEPDGRRYRGARAAGRVLRELGGGWRVLGWAAALPGAGLVYALVARGRGRLSAVWGDPPPCPE